jgi:hypothetical protein
MNDGEKNHNRQNQETSEFKRHFGVLKNLTGNELRKYLVNLWFENSTMGLFGTLSFNRSFYFERGFGCVDDFFKGILQKVHGQRWHKRIRRKQDFVVYGFCEHKGENVHFHFGVWGEEEELSYLREHGNEVWKQLQPQGDCSTEKIKDVFAAADYSFKTAENRDSQAALYTFTFPSQQYTDRAKNRRKPDKTENRAKIWGNKVEKQLNLRGKISNTKKNRGKMSRYGEGKT